MNMHDVHWNGWRLTQSLGGGRNGKVFQMQKKSAGGVETAALKVLPIPTDPNTVSRLLAQGKTPEQVKQQLRNRLDAAYKAYGFMASFRNHPNVLAAQELRCEPMADGYSWRLMVKTELCTPLLVAFPMGMEEQQVLAMGTDVATALVLCHGQGLIHEGVKASNVFAGKDGAWQLGDFGAAKAGGMPCGGDMSSMSPEVYWGMDFDARNDIYALGILLYRMLNGGYLPFCGPGMTEADIQEANVRRLSGETLPAPPTGSPELQQLVLRACAYERDKRFSTAAELRVALLQLRGMDLAMPLWSTETALDSRTSDEIPPRRTKEKKPKKKIGAAALRTLAMIAAVLVLGVVGFFTIHIWSDVPCTEVAKCIICGKDAEKARGHQWEAADCLLPETCRDCGETKGEALGHQWNPATRETAATCAVCGATDGIVLQPTLWVMKIISTGWLGGHKQTQEGNVIQLSFPQDESFAGSDLLVMDAYGNEAPGGFALEWEKETAIVCPSDTLEPGVYMLQFSAGDAGAIVTLCYGYEEDFYLSTPEYFWSGDMWSSYAYGGYLSVTEQGVTLTSEKANATVFESALEMVGVEKDAEGIVRPVPQDPVALGCMRYAQAGQESITVFTYGELYLGCDGEGNVYFSEALDESCFWVSK